jgi:hypothetical protein
MRILLVGLWNTVPFLLLLSATVLGLKTTLRGSTKAWPASNAPLKVCDQQLKRESSQGKTTTNPIPYYTPNQTLLSYWIDAFWAICLLLLFGGGIFTYHCSEVPTSDGCIPLIKILWNCDSHYIPSKSMYNFSEISGRLCLFVRLAVLSLRPQITSGREFPPVLVEGRRWHLLESLAFGGSFLAEILSSQLNDLLGTTKTPRHGVHHGNNNSFQDFRVLLLNTVRSCC